jgi:hypothetical protein
MAESTPSICFVCGQRADAANQLNRLPDGRPCPTCADRLLAMLPPALPAFVEVAEPVEDELASEPYAEPFEGDFDRPA